MTKLFLFCAVVVSLGREEESVEASAARASKAPRVFWSTVDDGVSAELLITVASLEEESFPSVSILVSSSIWTSVASDGAVSGMETAESISVAALVLDGEDGLSATTIGEGEDEEYERSGGITSTEDEDRESIVVLKCG